MRNKPNVNPNAVWDESRCKELQMLDELLREVSALNRGSGFIQCVQRSIELAEKLSKFDANSGRPSFKQFLTHVCVNDRFPDQQKTRSGA